MDYVILALSVIFGATRFLSSKKVDCGTNKYSNFVFLFIVSITATITLLFFNPDMGKVDYVVLLFSFLFALCTLGSTFFYMKASHSGPTSISALIYSMAFLIPTIFGSIYYHESISVGKIIGICLIVVASILTIKKNKGEKFSIMWLIFAFLAMMCAGTVGILQKVYRNSISNAPVVEMLLETFIMMSIFTLLGTLAFRKYKEKAVTSKFSVLSILAGLGTAIPNLFNLYLNGVLPSAIMFPVYNAGSMILTTVVAWIFFKEKLHPLKVIGIILAIGAIILVGVC